MSKKKAEKLLEKLEEKIEKFKTGEEFMEFMEFMSNFHNYSFRNKCLIFMQNPNSTMIAGYNKWKKMGRQVQKGENAIKILAPIMYTKKVEVENEKTGEIETKKEKFLGGFKTVNVFDISQTKGEPIPKLDLSLKDNFDLRSELCSLGEKENIKIEFLNPNEDKTLSETCFGYSSGGYIAINNNFNCSTQSSTLIHELSHEFLHKGKKLSKEQKEIEADAVSYIVLNNFNIESKTEKYLSLYKKGYDIKASLERINKTSKKIIEHLEKELAEKNKKIS